MVAYTFGAENNGALLPFATHQTYHSLHPPDVGAENRLVRNAPPRTASELAGPLPAPYEEKLMAKCQVCGKGPLFGHNRSHSMRATRKISQPNVFKRNILIKGEEKRVNICARCLRTQMKSPR